MDRRRGLLTQNDLKQEDITKEHLYVEAIDDLTVSFSTNDIEYSFDQTTWHNLTHDVRTPIIHAGTKCYFRASGLIPTLNDGIGKFTFSGNCNIGGNAMSMIWGSDFVTNTTMPYDYNLRRMFRDNATLINAKDMIVACDNITVRGCDIMFKNCTNLVQGCILPATTLAERAYANMYEGCSNLKIGSDLPALNVTATYCYNAMYANCSKLRYLKAMLLNRPNNSNSQGAITGNWLLNVATYGVFVKNANAKWDVKGVSGIPALWTVELA